MILLRIRPFPFWTLCSCLINEIYLILLLSHILTHSALSMIAFHVALAMKRSVPIVTLKYFTSHPRRRYAIAQSWIIRNFCKCMVIWPNCNIISIVDGYLLAWTVSLARVLQPLLAKRPLLLLARHVISINCICSSITAWARNNQWIDCSVW